MSPNKSFVTIIRKLSKPIGGPQFYQGVAELADRGYTLIELAVPFGCKDFPSIPCMVMVDCEHTFCEIRQGKWPLLTVTEWEPVQHYYNYHM